MLQFLLKALLTIVALLGGLGLLMPSHFEVQRSLEMHGVPEDVYAVVGDLATWDDWSPFTNRQDPGLSVTLSDDPMGESAFRRWRGPRLGTGELRITRYDEESGVELSFQEPRRPPSQMTFQARQLENKVRMVEVTWIESGDLGWNPVYRWMGLVWLDEHSGRRMEKGLLELRRVMREL
jgi:hypothetical protein